METDQNYYWIDRLRADPKWSKFRFKRLDKGHYVNSNVNILHEFIDVVNFTVFVRIEEDRLPLFIGPSYKVMINLRSVYLDYPQKRTIAILEETGLPGNYRGLTIKEYFRGEKELLAFFRNVRINLNYFNMNTTKVVEEALKVRNTINAKMNSDLNPIDMSLDPVPPFKVSDEIKLVIIGQDPTIKNKSQREKISTTLNLNRGGSLATYVRSICDGLGTNLENVYATNIFKYFYSIPPANTMNVLYDHLDMNLELLRNELQVYADLPVISLGEPVLQLLSNIPDDKVRKYWDYNKGISGLSFSKCTDNDLDRPFYPFPHQPSIRKKFYNQFLNHYLEYVKKDLGK